VFSCCCVRYYKPALPICSSRRHVICSAQAPQAIPGKKDIYFSTELDVARSHSSPISGWQNGNLKGYGVVAICEILSGQWYFVNDSESCLVVPSENEKDVAIRYLIVCKDEYNEKGFLTTASHMLSTETRFLERYQSLRKYYSQGNEGLFQKHQHLDGHNIKLMKTQ